MNENYKELFTNLLLPFCWFFILIFCCFLFAFTSHASDVSIGDLPYYVNSNRGLNTCIPNEAIEIAITRIEQTFRETYNQTDNISYICFTNDGLMNGVLYDIMVIPNPVVFTRVTENFNYRENSVLVQASGFQVFRVEVKTDLSASFRTLNAGLDAYLLGSSGTSNLNGGTFTPRYPFYMYGVDELKSPTDVVVFSNQNQIIVPDIGHATAPDNFEDPVYNTGHAKPTTVPQLTINNYTWTTPPTSDFSTLENTAKSIFDILQWLSNNLIGEFSNLITNLQNIGNYIGSTIQYYGNLIISNIQNGITNFYNNMVSLFEPISNLISYISEPVSGTVIYDNISGTTLIQSINTVDTALTTFQGTFTGLSEPNSFVIPIHLESLPSSWFGTQTTQYLDLSWINSDMRTLIRGFMWAIITYALFITIVDSIANYINGGGDES